MSGPTDLTAPGGTQSAAKRVSWVELYFDLVFVVAVAQVAEVIVEDPEWPGLQLGLGLFALLWWTWIGFTTLNNRYGVEDSGGQRLFVVASTLPCGVAAIAVHAAAEHDYLPLGIALAAARLLLAGGHVVAARSAGALARGPQRRAAVGYVVSAALIATGAVLGGRGLALLGAIAVLLESAALLGRGNRALRQARAQHDLTILRPSEPGTAVEPHHFAERFGLFVIILLGEVVASAQGSLFGPHRSTSTWIGLVAAIALAGALWWLYFDSAVELNARLLQLAGGSPAMASALYAGGHIAPAFGLILVAAGSRLLLQGAPPDGAFSLVSTGLGLYLAATRVVLGGRGRGRAMPVLRVALVVVTFQLGWLLRPLGPTLFLLALCGWGAGCALVVTLNRGDPEAVPDSF